MKNLIKALNIFLKYIDDEYTPAYEHDIVLIHIDPNIVSETDRQALESLGVVTEGRFFSYSYNSIVKKNNILKG